MVVAQECCLEGLRGMLCSHLLGASSGTCCMAVPSTGNVPKGLSAAFPVGVGREINHCAVPQGNKRAQKHIVTIPGGVQEQGRCGTEGNGLVSNIGGRQTVGRDYLSGLFRS